MDRLRSIVALGKRCARRRETEGGRRQTKPFSLRPAGAPQRRSPCGATEQLSPRAGDGNTFSPQGLEGPVAVVEEVGGTQLAEGVGHLDPLVFGVDPDHEDRLSGGQLSTRRPRVRVARHQKPTPPWRSPPPREVAPRSGRGGRSRTRPRSTSTRSWPVADSAASASSTPDSSTTARTCFPLRECVSVTT